MRIKWLPWSLAALHAAWVILLFGEAIYDMERHGMNPILLYFTDYPFSVIELWFYHLIPMGWPEQWIAGLIFLVLGSAWFYLIGWVIRTVATKLFGKKKEVPAISD